MWRLLAMASAAALIAPAASANYLFAGCTEQTTTRVNCENAGLSEAPEGIPDGFTRLMMKDNTVHSNGGDDAGTGELNAFAIRNIKEHPSLREIELQRNGILSIAAATFEGFGDLTVLKLFGNLLGTITANALDGLTSLQTLYINNNLRLWKINSGAFSAMSGTLSELFAKDCPLLGVVEDGSLNALTFRPLFIDMTNGGSMCMVPPFGSTECVCGNGGAYTDDEGVGASRRAASGLDWLISGYSTLSWVGASAGFCEVATPEPTTSEPTPAPTPAPTASPATSEPTPAPTPLPTASPASSAPTLPPPTTAPPSGGLFDDIIADGSGEEEEREIVGAGDEESVAAAMGMGMGMGMGTTTVADGDDQNREGEDDESESTAMGKKANKVKSSKASVDGGDERLEGENSESSEDSENSSTGRKEKKTKKTKSSALNVDSTVAYQPWGDLQSNVNLNGKPSASAVIVLSGFVVLIAGAAVARRKGQAARGYTSVEAADCTTPVRPVRATLDPAGASAEHYNTFAGAPDQTGAVLV